MIKICVTLNEDQGQYNPCLYMPSLMMMTLVVSKESLVRDTHRHSQFYVKLLKVNFENNKRRLEKFRIEQYV